jgi:acetyltransferase-like isoleucine patch superfamily enzyme
LKKIKIFFKLYYSLIRKIISVHGFLLERAHQKLDSNIRLKKFKDTFGYLPKDLEINDVSILRLSAQSTVGPGNKILYADIPMLKDTKSVSLISLGKYCWTGNNVELNIATGNQIIIKDYSTIQDNCKIIGDVTIEKYCLFAPSVFISSGNHYALKGISEIIRNQDDLHSSDLLLIKRHSKPVHIEEDCWLGYSSFIKAGVYIGRGTVIGANAVVTKDTLPYSIIGGVPGIILSTRYKFNPPNRIEAVNPDHKPYFYRGFLQKKNESAINFDDHIVLDKSSGVIFTKKDSFQDLNIAGSFLNNKTVDDLRFSIIFNGCLKASKSFAVSSHGLFHLQLNYHDFETCIMPNEELAFRMNDHFNIFSFWISSNTLASEENVLPLIALKYFEAINKNS